MCAACHTENKALSLPANRLLRDELNQEADEIMNELKIMQDLYIDRDATDDDDNDENDVKNEKQQIISNWCNYSPLVVQQQQQNNKIKDKNKAGNENTNKVLLQMNQFIEDWLRPATLQGEKYDIWYTNKAKDTNYDNATENDIQNIWQIKDETATHTQLQPPQQEEEEKEEIVVKRGIAVADTWKPLNLLLQLNAADAPAQQSRDDTFLSNLSWEHENLAAIWNNSTPLPTAVSHVDENENNINEAENSKNFDNKNQPSERVKAFLKHLGAINQRREKSATTAHNTPKLAIVTAMATGNRKRRHSESLNFLELVVDCAIDPKDKMDLEKLKDILGIDGICFKKTTKLVDTNLANDYGIDKNINENGNGNVGNDVVDGNLVVAGEYGFDVQQQQQQRQQQKTVITCKYWATAAAATTVATGKNNDNNKKNNMKQQYENIDSIIDIDINDELIGSFALDPNNLEDGKAGAQFSCQFDKNNGSILRHVTTAMITRPLTR